jgi:AcrR family transcriptional regulator
MAAPPRVNIHYTAMGSENVPRRPYRKRRRAEQEATTRLKITEAAVKLHGTIGPARTTISDVAAQAGVQRATVYRHFPDLESLFLSCSAHWASLNPPPDPSAWSQITDPDERLRRALTEVYTWYEWAEPMLANVIRDAPLVPASARAGQRFEQQFLALRAALMNGRSLAGRARIRTAATIGHALDFATWRSLTREQGLRRDEAVGLMAALVAAAPQPTHRNPGGAAGLDPRRGGEAQPYG